MGRRLSASGGAVKATVLGRQRIREKKSFRAPFTSHDDLGPWNSWRKLVLSTHPRSRPNSTFINRALLRYNAARVWLKSTAVTH